MFVSPGNTFDGEDLDLVVPGVDGLHPVASQSLPVSSRSMDTKLARKLSLHDNG